uniref:Uncharacterized protein n=1 Tax=Oryza meridionalis TaxID=40149 RepID=A0A0E0D411_9ORYZ
MPFPRLAARFARRWKGEGLRPTRGRSCTPHQLRSRFLKLLQSSKKVIEETYDDWYKSQVNELVKSSLKNQQKDLEKFSDLLIKESKNIEARLQRLEALVARVQDLKFLGGDRNIVDPPLLPHLVTFQCMPSPIWPDRLVWIAQAGTSSSELDRWNARNLSGDNDQSQLDPVWNEDLKLSTPQQYGPRMLVINSQDLKSLKICNVFLMSSSKPHFLFIQQVFNGWQFSQLATTTVDDCQCFTHFMLVTQFLSYFKIILTAQHVLY